MPTHNALIKARLPEFMKTLYPQFTDFITAYFRELEAKGEVLHEITHFLENIDSGNVHAEYWDKIFADLAFGLREEKFDVDKRLLVLFIRHYYMSRGTAKSVEFLFKLLFSDNPKITYPREKLLIPSATEYRNETWMYLVKDADLTTIRRMEQLAADFGLVGRGISSGASCVIDKVDVVSDRIRLHISTTNTFLPHESIEITGKEFSKLFENSPCFEVKPVTSSEPLTEVNLEIDGIKIDVTLLDKGSIKDVAIDNAGQDYKVGDSIVADDKIGFYAEVSQVSVSGAIEKIKIHNHGSNIIKVPQLIVYSKQGKNALLKAVPDDKLGRPLRLRVHSPVFAHISHPTITFAFEPTAVFTTPKDWVNDNHRIGYNGIILDSFYWHQFSYLIESGVSRPEYEHFVKDQVHPPGYELFSALGLKSKSKLIESLDDKLRKVNKAFIGSLYASMIANLANRQYEKWQQGKTYKIGDVIIHGNNVYIATSNGEAGHLAPRHTKGNASDGGLLWQYVQTVNADLNAISHLYIALSNGKEPVGDAFYAKKLNYNNLRLGIKYERLVLGDRVKPDTLYKTDENQLFYCVQGGIAQYTPAKAAFNTLTADGVCWRYVGDISAADLPFVTDDFVPMIIKDKTLSRNEIYRAKLLAQYGAFSPSDRIVSSDTTGTVIDYEITPDGKLKNYYVSKGGHAASNQIAVLSKSAPGQGAKAHALLANKGIHKIEMEEPGSGYQSAIVSIIGDGHGATAIAQIDRLGAITGIEITNAGQDYTWAKVIIIAGVAAAVFELETRPISIADMLYSMEPDALLIHQEIKDIPGFIDHTARYDGISILANANKDYQLHLAENSIYKIDKTNAIMLWYKAISPKQRAKGQHEKILIAFTLE